MKKSLFQLGAVTLLVGIAAQVYAERNPVLPPPGQTPSVQKESKAIGWANGQKPTAIGDFEVTELASMKYPRLLYLLPSGDVLVSQAYKRPDDNGENSPNQITLLKMKGSELVSQSVAGESLKLPFGMALKDKELFVSSPEAITAYPFDGEKITGAGRQIATLPFPKPQRHWTRFLLFNKDFSKLYVSVGSVSNIGEGGDPLDPRNATILEMNPDGSEQRIYASGMRNAVSIAWEPSTRKLWAVVNERDELGDDVPPDYLTHVEENGFYGWPYAYWGKNEDPRVAKRPDLVAKSITPDYAVGAHTASLGLTFTEGTQIPAPYNKGALIAQHGSWNRSKFSGYKVHYVPFENGLAMDGESDFLVGFVANEAQGTVYGRPVSTVVLADGTVLVADDVGGKIWKVSPTKK
jgi:glucose/arabinose dehydrogenase